MKSEHLQVYLPTPDLRSDTYRPVVPARTKYFTDQSYPDFHHKVVFIEFGYAYQTGKVDQVLNLNNGRDNLLFKGGASQVGAGLNYFVALPVAITLSGSLQAGAKSPVYINGFTSTDKADVAAFRISPGVIVYLSELF